MLWHTHSNGKAFLMTNLQQNFRSIAYFTIWMYVVYKKIYIFVFFYVSKFAANFLKYYIFDQWSVRRSRKKCIFVIFVCFQNLPTFSNTVKLYEQRTHVSKMKKLSSGAKVSFFTCWARIGVWGRIFINYILLVRAAPEEILELMACNCPRKWTGEKDCCVQNGMRFR